MSARLIPGSLPAECTACGAELGTTAGCHNCELANPDLRAHVARVHLRAMSDLFRVHSLPESGR